VNGDNHVGAHFADDVGGGDYQRRPPSTKNLVAQTDGSEYAGNGKWWERIASEERAALEKRRLLPEMSSVETQRKGIGRSSKEGMLEVFDGFAIDQEIDLVAGVESRGEVRAPVFEADLNGIGDGRVRLVLRRKERVFVRACRRPKKQRPIGGVEDFLELVRGACRWRRCRQRGPPHAGAGEIVDGDVIASSNHLRTPTVSLRRVAPPPFESDQPIFGGARQERIGRLGRRRFVADCGPEGVVAGDFLCR